MNQEKHPKGRLTDGQSITHIGYCSGTMEAVQHVQAVLASAGIEPIMEGSVGYDMAVFDADVARAQELLRQDTEAARYRIKLYADGA
jgi:hypothetical protein